MSARHALKIQLSHTGMSVKILEASMESAH